MSSKKSSGKKSKQPEKSVETNYDDLLQAVKSIKLGNQKVRPTAARYNIPKTNLLRYMQKLDSEIPDITAVPDSNLKDILRSYARRKPPLLGFDPKSENTLVGYILLCCKHYYGLSSFHYTNNNIICKMKFVQNLLTQSRRAHFTNTLVYLAGLTANVKSTSVSV